MFGIYELIKVSIYRRTHLIFIYLYQVDFVEQGQFARVSWGFRLFTSLLRRLMLPASPTFEYIISNIRYIFFSSADLGSRAASLAFPRTPPSLLFFSNRGK